MSYTRVNWQDAPSVSTPLSASNLNKMDAGIKQNADDIEALQQHTYDSALDDTSTNAPQTKAVKKAIEDAVESVTIITDPTLSNEGQAADAKATGEAVAQVKSAIAFIESGIVRYELTANDVNVGHMADKNNNEIVAADFTCTSLVDISETNDVVKISTVIYENAGLIILDFNKSVLLYINGSNAAEYGYTASKKMQEVTITKPVGAVYYRANAFSGTGGTYTDASDFYYCYPCNQNKVIEAEQYINTSDVIYKATTQSAYINASGVPTVSSSWKLYIFDLTAINIEAISNLVCYTNNTAFYAVGLYNSATLNADTFIGGVTFTATGKNHFSNIGLMRYPNAVCLAVATRTATSDEFVCDAVINGNLRKLYNRVKNIEDNEEELTYNGELKNIYKNIPCSNDFTFVGDELWCPVIDYGTNETIINRYKFINKEPVLINSITTDFGHINTLDYDPVNDCLIFGNGANDTETVGNWFAVVPHPLTLGASATLSDNAIVYNVDIGYKVQAVWGESNCGEHNVAIIFSNNATRILTVLLTKTNNEFDGNFVILSDHTTETVIGVGGADYFDGFLYIGNGQYSVVKVSMTDYSADYNTKHFYLADGTKFIGSMQGVYIDNHFIWTNFNVTNNPEYKNAIMQNWK